MCIPKVKKTLLVMMNLTLLLMLFSSVAVMAQEPDNKDDVFLSEFTCSGKVTDVQIETIAKMMVAGEETKTAHLCYENLSLEDKALVFETVAVLRDISIDDLRKDADGMEEDIQLQARGYWTQLVERVPFSAVFRPLVSSFYYFTNDTICDDDPTDTDYIFIYGFPAPMTNPDALRVFSSNWLVDSMLVYYQVRNGGLKGYGDTTNPYVQICVGDTGVSTAGGANNVKNNMKTHN